MNENLFCPQCKYTFQSVDDIAQHWCPIIYKKIGRTIKVELIKSTRWQRFCHRFWSMDISYGLAIMGLVVMNAIFLRHFNFTFWESTIEGLGWGFAIPRLLK